jgi:hypothetical protein
MTVEVRGALPDFLTIVERLGHQDDPSAELGRTAPSRASRVVRIVAGLRFMLAKLMLVA